MADEVLATFHDGCSLQLALRQVREARGISLETLDEIAGLPKGYSSKVLAPRGSRKVTLQSLGWLLAGLGAQCQIVDDADMLRQINGRMVPRDNKVVRNGAVTITLSRRFLSQTGRKGAQVRNARRMRRKEAARKAALARWHGQNGG
jgi:hypothetical protein